MCHWKNYNHTTVNKSTTKTYWNRSFGKCCRKESWCNRIWRRTNVYHKKLLPYVQNFRFQHRKPYWNRVKPKSKITKSFPLKQLVQETQRYPVQQHMTSTQLGKTYKRSSNQGAPESAFEKKITTEPWINLLWYLPKTACLVKNLAFEQIFGAIEFSKNTKMLVTFRCGHQSYPSNKEKGPSNRIQPNSKITKNLYFGVFGAV